MKTTIDILPGELADRIGILELRLEHLPPSDQCKELRNQLCNLQAKWHALPESQQVRSLVAELRQINFRLWEIEDQLRLHESRQDFGHSFVALARAVYQLNDQRSALKRAINLQLCGQAAEAKVYFSTGANATTT